MTSAYVASEANDVSTEENPMAPPERKMTMAKFTFNVHKVEAALLSNADDGKLTAKQNHTLTNLKKLDRDGDGEISLIEILELEEDLEKADSTNKSMKKILCGIVVGIIFCLMSIMCMGIAAVEITKETRVKGGNPVAKSTSATTVAPSPTARRRRNRRLGQKRRLAAPTYSAGDTTAIKNAKTEMGFTNTGTGPMPAMGAPGAIEMAGVPGFTGGVGNVPPVDPEFSSGMSATMSMQAAVTLADLAQEDLTGSEKALRVQEDYNAIVDAAVTYLMDEHAKGETSYDVKKIEEAVPGFNQIEACMHVEGGAMMSYPVDHCPTMPGPDGKPMFNLQDIKDKAGTEMAIVTNAKHTACLLERNDPAITGKTDLQVMQEMAASVPTLTNGAPRLVGLGVGGPTSPLKSANKIKMKNPATGDVLELVGTVAEVPQEEPGMAGMLEVVVESPHEGVAPGHITMSQDKLVFDASARAIVAEANHGEFMPPMGINSDLMDMSSELHEMVDSPATMSSAFPKHSHFDTSMLDIMAETTTSTTGKFDVPAMVEMFPGAAIDPAAGTVELPAHTATPNIPSGNVPMTMTKNTLECCDCTMPPTCDKVHDYVEIHPNGEAFDPVTGEMETQFNAYTVKSTTVDHGFVDTPEHTSLPVTVTHVSEPYHTYGAEMATADMTEIHDETLTMCDPAKCMSITSQSTNPFTEAPVTLPEGATGVHHDGSFYSGTPGTDTQQDCHHDMSIYSSRPTLMMEPDPMMGMISDSVEIPPVTLAKRRLAQLDAKKTTKGDSFARAHAHARILVAAQGGNADVFKVAHAQHGCEHVVEHCGARTTQEKEDFAAMRQQGVEDAKAANAAIAGASRRLGSSHKRRLVKHLHTRKLALYTSHRTIRSSRSHRRFHHHARRLLHKVHHIVHRHERSTGRRLGMMEDLTVSAPALTDAQVTSYINANAPADIKEEYNNANDQLTACSAELETMYAEIKDVKAAMTSLAGTANSEEKHDNYEELADTMKRLREHVKTTEAFQNAATRQKEEIQELARAHKSIENAKTTALTHTAALTQQVKDTKAAAMLVAQAQQAAGGGECISSYVDPNTLKPFDFEHPENTPSVTNPSTFFADYSEAHDMHEAEKNLMDNLNAIQSADALLVNMEEGPPKCQYVLPCDAPHDQPHVHYEIEINQHAYNDEYFQTQIASEAAEFLSMDMATLEENHPPTCDGAAMMPMDGIETPFHARRQLMNDVNGNPVTADTRAKDHPCKKVKKSARKQCKLDFKAAIKAAKQAAKKAAKKPQPGEFSSVATDPADVMIEEVTRFSRSMGDVAQVHKEATEAKAACSTVACTEYHQEEIDRANARADDLGRENYVRQIEAPIRVSPRERAAIVVPDRAERASIEQRSRDVVREETQRSTACPGASRRRRLTQDPDPCTKPRTAQRQQTDLQSGMRPTERVSNDEGRTRRDPSTGRESSVSRERAMEMPREDPAMADPVMCNDTRHIHANCSAIVRTRASSEMPFETRQEHVGTDTRHYCFHHTEREEPCCKREWDMRQQDECLASKHYCDNHGPRENACCAKRDRFDQDECLERGGTNPINDENGRERRVDPDNRADQTDVMDKLVINIPEDDQKWMAVGEAFEVRAKVVDDVGDRRVASSDGVYDKVEGIITIDKARDGLTISTNMKFEARPKIDVRTFESKASECRDNGGSLNECCGKHKWDERRQEDVCDYSVVPELPPVEGMVEARYDERRDTIVVEFEARARGWKESEQSVLTYGFHLGLKWYPEFGSFEPFKGEVDIELDQRRPNKDLNFRPREEKQLKTEGRSRDVCERYDERSCDRTCQEECSCSERGCVATISRDAVSRDMISNERGGKDPEGCGNQIGCRNPLDRSIRGETCVDSCARGCADKKQATMCNRDDDRECMEVCYTPSERDCGDLGKFFCEESNECIRDCSTCARDGNMVAGGRGGNKCVESQPNTCQGRGQIYCETLRRCVTVNDRGMNECADGVGREVDMPRERSVPMERRPAESDTTRERNRAQADLLQNNRPRDTRSDRHGRSRRRLLMHDDVTMTPEEKMMATSEVYLANVSDVRANGVADRSGTVATNTYNAPAIKKVNKDYCMEKGEVLCDYYGNVQCMADCMECPGMDWGYEGKCMTPRQVTKTASWQNAKSYWCPLTNTAGDCSGCTGTESYDTHDIQNATTGMCEIDAMALINANNGPPTGEWCHIEYGSMIKEGWVENCYNECNLNNTAGGTIRKEASVNGVCEAVTPEICNKIGLLWCPNNVDIMSGGQCVENCRDQCFKIEFDPTMLTHEELMMMSYDGNYGNEARSILRLPSNNSGTCVEEKASAETCDDKNGWEGTMKYCPPTDQCVNSCWECDSGEEWVENQWGGWMERKYWSNVNSAGNLCEKPCDNNGAFCPVTQQCLANNEHYNEDTWTWFPDTSCADSCFEYSVGTWDMTTNKRVCSKPTPESCMNAGEIYCPSLKKCVSYQMDQSPCAAGCKKEKFDPVWTMSTYDNPSSYKCEASAEEANKCGGDESWGSFYCRSDWGAYCTDNCEWCQVNGLPTIGVNGVCSAESQPTPVYEMPVEVPIYDYSNGTDPADSDAWVNQTIITSDPIPDNVAATMIADDPTWVEPNATTSVIQVPNYNISIPTEMVYEPVTMFWCNSTFSYVEYCDPDCPGQRASDGEYCKKLTSYVVQGCQIPEAQNYDPEANAPVYPEEDCSQWQQYPEHCYSCNFNPAPPNVTAYADSWGLNTSHFSQLDANVFENITV